MFVQPVCELQEVTVGNYAAGAKHRGMDLQTIEPSGLILWLRSRVMASYAMSSLGFAPLTSCARRCCKKLLVLNGKVVSLISRMSRL